MEKQHVYVVGPKRLQNELMVCLIQGKTGCTCTCLERAESIPAAGNDKAGRGRLVLFDSQGLAPEPLLEILESLFRTLGGNCTLALFNMQKDSGVETDALALGVRGFFYEDDTAESLAKGVGNIIEGDVWVSRKKMVECLLCGKTRGRPEAKPSSILSRREIDIIHQLVKGASNGEIAASLYISNNTVRTHIYNIFKKINVSNRVQASLWAGKNMGEESGFPPGLLN